MRILDLSALVLVVGLAVGCGSAPPKVPTATNAAPAETSSANVQKQAEVQTSGRALRRSDVKAFIKRGLGYCLSLVTLDERPVMRDGKFYGFRLVALLGSAPAGPAASEPSPIDLRPGDILTSVNALPIERPEQALLAFRSLEVASELVIGYERGGKAGQVRLPIVEE